MIELKMQILILAHDTQGLGNGACAWREEGTNQPAVSVLEYWPGEQRRKCYHQGHKLAGHAQPLLFQRSQMDKVELRSCFKTLTPVVSGRDGSC
jgi:hypothetical protein